jgi:hypothetical protein
MSACQMESKPVAGGEGIYMWSDDSTNGQRGRRQDNHARHIEKIIVKPYAGKPHVRFERRFLETGQQ